MKTPPERGRTIDVIPAPPAARSAPHVHEAWRENTSVNDGRVASVIPSFVTCAVWPGACPTTVTVQEAVDPACREPDWMADASEAIDVQPDTSVNVPASVVLEVPLATVTGSGRPGGQPQANPVYG